MSSMPDVRLQLRVVKLGGSLLTLPQLPKRLIQWLADQPPAQSLFVVGGGPMVDAVREVAAAYEYDQQFLHWLCIDLLESSFQLVAAQLPEWRQICTDTELQQEVERHRSNTQPAGPALVRVPAYYTRHNEAGLPLRLPMSWDTTSDSLSALLAHVVAADDLVLLKACPVRCQAALSLCDWQELADLGVVDPAFPRSIRGLKRVRCANL